MVPDAVQRQVLLANSETGETLRDTALSYWNSVGRQYDTAYPGHNRVVEYLETRRKEAEAKVADTDPNPDMLSKRRTNIGELIYQIQQNLSTTIRAKDKALRDWVSLQVNDPNHRHGVASAGLDTMTERFRTYIAQMEKDREGLKGGVIAELTNRDTSLREINGHARDFMLSLIATAKRREIDEQKENYILAARHIDVDTLESKGIEASIIFYQYMIGVISSLRAEMDRYVERMDSRAPGSKKPNGMPFRNLWM